MHNIRIIPQHSTDNGALPADFSAQSRVSTVISITKLGSCPSDSEKDPVSYIFYKSLVEQQQYFTHEPNTSNVLSIYQLGSTLGHVPFFVPRHLEMLTEIQKL